jgi:hypothetical protein
LEWCVGFEANGIASVAHIQHRTSSRANRTAFKAILIEIYRAKVLAVAAVLPLKLNWILGLAVEIQLAQYVTLIFTLDRRLSRSEESSFVLGAKNSHFPYSL